MKKKLFTSFFVLSAFFLFGQTKVAWADPCSSPDFCTTLSECGSTSTGTCDVSGQICCSKKKSTTSDDTTPGSGIQVPTGTGLPSGDIMSVLGKTLDWIEGVFLTLALIAFAIVGIMYLLSLGNASSTAHTNAKAYFGQAVTALLIVGGSYILITTINYLLQG